MDNELLAAQKDEIRERIRTHRRSLTAAERLQATDTLTQTLIALVTARGARTVSCYLPVHSEPDTTPFLEWARENGIRVLLPSCREDLLLDWIEPAGTEVVPGRLGLPEPVGEVFSPTEVENADLMLIPAAAVDTAGNRVGWGGGYFDRLLGSMQEKPPVFAIVYDSEILQEAPAELHDIAVTGAITQSGIHYFDREPLPADTAQLTVLNPAVN